MYAPNYDGGNTVSVISGTSVVNTIILSASSEIDPSLIIYAGGSYMDTINSTLSGNGGVTVSVISGTSIVAKPSSGGISGYMASYGDALTYDQKNGYVYVLNGGGSVGGPSPECNDPQPTISFISGTSYLATTGLPITAGAEESIAYDSANGYIYASYYGDVYIYNGLSQVSSIPIPTGLYGNGTPWSTVYNPSNGDVYVTTTSGGIASTDAVLVISGTSVVNTIVTGTSPGFAAVDPSNGDVYVAGGSSISVISGSNNMIIGTIPTTSGWSAMAYDPGNGYMYVAVANSVYVISGTSLITTINLPESVVAFGNGECGDIFPVMAYDPSDGYMYLPLYGYPYEVAVIS